MRTFAFCLLALAFSPLTMGGQETPGAILEHSRSVYGALSSYSDSGTTVIEYGPSNQPGRDENSFSTWFNRAPRHFLFEYRKPSDRMVIWGDPDAFHVWWKATGQVSEYPNPKNTGALTLSDYPTNSTISKIPPLLYSKANLPGAVAAFEPTRVAGTEEVDGSKCYRLEGTASDSYGQTGNKVNQRHITVWIDASSFLVRKVVEEAATAPGSVNRTTSTFRPQANPQISDDHFQFAPPR
jgi:outer membrane lipoprotein-sorting protein